MKSRSVIAGLLCLVALSYCASYRNVPIEQWLGMEFIIDGRIDIQVKVPPAKAGVEKLGPHFISSTLESFERLFLASYDPGWGRDRGLLLTKFASSVKRIEPKLSYESGSPLEYIKKNVYLTRDDAAEDFDIVGEVIFNDHPWLRVNLISGHRRGVSYATIINGQYILLVSLFMYGEESDQSRLFSVRHEALKKVVNTVKFSTE